jgi:hypothetical protein
MPPASSLLSTIQKTTTSVDYEPMSRRTEGIDGNGYRPETRYKLAGHVVSVKNKMRWLPRRSAMTRR